MMMNQRLYSLVFNGRSNPSRIAIAVNDRGETLVWFPGCTEAVIVTTKSRITIDISGYGPGPDLAILVEASRETSP